MYNYVTPILYLNMGGEMLYVLQQRLKAQKISVEKSIQVLEGVTTALLSPKILSCIFEEESTSGMTALRSTLEAVVLSSIVKLDASSMDKLFDLMIMMVKYQLTAATGPKEVILLTLNHTDAMRDMVSHPTAQRCLGMLHQMVIDIYEDLTCDEVWNIRHNCLKELETYCVRVSLLLRFGLQNDDGSFNITSRKYDEKYEENRSTFFDMKLRDMHRKSSCDGSFNLYGERGTILGKNMYAMTNEMLKLTRKGENEDIQNCGAKAELGMLAIQLGTEEASYTRPFTLNLFSNDVHDSENIGKDSSDSKEADTSDRVDIKSQKTVFNEDYKTKLDNVRADFSEDKLNDLENQMLILDMLEKAE
ncbi:organic solute carrier partner 1 [Megalopta genalis]|uniref:organic solute carrier partner 1 n=1 Tax=Megalopta genalis TaxID=115081 RepID=UPI0014436D9D|nr:protein OSCP1-like [Megalopta genalis]